MASDRATFALGFEDETSGAAESAASALLRLKASMDDGQASLKEMQSQMRLLKGATTPNAQAIQDLADRMAAAKSQVASATAAFVNMGGTSKAVAAAQQQIAAAAEQSRAAIVSDAEAAAALAAQSQAAAAAATRAEQAIKAMAAAAALNASKFDYAANSQKAYAKSVTDSVMAGINKKLPVPSLDGVNKARDAMMEVEKQANKLATATAKIAAPAKASGASVEQMTALAKGALGPMGGLFEKATLITKGLSNGGMAGAAIAAAVAIAVLTSAVVTGYFALAKLAVTSNKVAMERLSKTAKTAEDNFKKLFSGVHVEKFVDLVEEVAKMLDESSASAAAVKEILATMLNPLFDSVGGAGPLVKRFFQGMVIGALIVTIGVLRLRKALDDLLPAPLVGKVDWLKTALYAGAAATFALAAALVALAAVGVGILLVALIGIGFAVGLFIVAPLLLATAVVLTFVASAVAAFVLLAAVVLISLAMIFAPFIILGAVIYAAIAYFDDIKAAVMDFGASAADAAGSLISGLVNGITSGAGAVMSAIRDLASNMTGALKAALGIASPSKVFASLGEFTSEGFAQGVEAGGGSVEGAVESMAAGAASSAGKAGGGGGRGGKVVVQLTVQGPPAYQAAVRGAYEQLCETLESGLNMAGYPVAVEVV